MSIATLILGESGTGKSASLRNLDPDTTLLIQTIDKPLPFRATGWKPQVTDNWETIIKYMHAAAERGKERVIIDDFQYLLANEFMRRSAERGFDKFTEIGLHAWSVIREAANAHRGLRVYILSHTTTDDSGHTKAKTIGKLLDEKITVEGMFTIVLRTMINDQGYFFSTQNSGQDTTKSPIDMFTDRLIPNDLATVDQAICSYYNIQTAHKEQAA